MIANGSDDLARLMTEIGLDGPYEQSRYIGKMSAWFGRDGRRFMDSVDRWLASGANPAGALDLYREVARKPEMARLVSAHQYSSLYRKVGELVSSLPEEIGRDVVFDFGCGFGLLTSLIGGLRPGWRVVGVDRSEILRAAKAIASKHSFGNVDFAGDNFDGGSYGESRLVIANCVTHELLDLRDEPESEGRLPDLSGLESMAQLAGTGGLVLTINRFPFPRWQIPLLDAAMSAVGLKVKDVGLPEVLRVEVPGAVDQLPVRCYASA